jgi:N-dimethylarginine dimethylaminohydrolase
MTKPSILMCPPDYYGIEYEINPWMHREQPADQPRAAQQWLTLRDALEQAGANIETLSPVPGLPDLVFTANAAIIFQRRAILARFRHVQRQGEEPVNAGWLTAHGFAVETLPSDLYFEGAGDALFCGDILFAGYRMRSAIQGHYEVGRKLDVRVIPLELIDPYYYHLDTCFCPLAQGMAIYYPPAFDTYGKHVLKQHVDELIPVAKEEAERFACNAVVVGKTVVTNTGCEGLHDELRVRGFVPMATPLDEFVKAGGSAKCLTLRLDGEEAAGWKFSQSDN